MAVFRIFQEMLSNVVRHAQARHVAIRVGVEPADGPARRLCIVVRDDGCGAPPQAFEAPDAYGVMGMRERARHFGGTVHISSEIGIGSTCSLVLPLLFQEHRNDPRVVV